MSTSADIPGRPAPTDMTSLVNAVIALADGVATTIRIARALSDAQRPIDLTGLDNVVGLLCARMLDLPLEHGRALRHRLAMLDGELNALAAALTPA